MKTLLLDDKIIAYSYEFEPKYSKEDILGAAENIISKKPYIKSDGYFFIETPKEFEDIYDFCKNICVGLCKSNGIFFDIANLHKWVTIMRNIPRQPIQFHLENNEPTYHNHYLMALNGGKQIPMYSFVYYLQMPDNLSDIDGHILFKNENNNVLKYLPKENEILIFESNVSHAPIPAKNSTKNRVVLAADFIISNQSKSKTII